MSRISFVQSFPMTLRSGHADDAAKSEQRWQPSLLQRGLRVTVNKAAVTFASVTSSVGHHTVRFTIPLKYQVCVLPLSLSWTQNLVWLLCPWQVEGKMAVKWCQQFCTFRGFGWVIARSPDAGVQNGAAIILLSLPLGVQGWYPY